MADADYQRLGAACFCGEPVKLWSGRGRRPKYCGPPCSEQANRARYAASPLRTVRCQECGNEVKTKSSRLKRCALCRSKPESKPRKETERRHHGACARCGGAFVGILGAKYCSAKCRVAVGNALAKVRDKRRCHGCQREFGADPRSKKRWCSEECKPKAQQGLFSCLGCGVEYRKGKRRPGQGEKFCSRGCYFRTVRAGKDARLADAFPKFSTYFAKACERCGCADGSRRDWTLCRSCKRADLLRAEREASRAWAEAKHKASAREVACDECGAVYCPLYGCKPGPVPLCSPCAKTRGRRHKATQRAKRNAVERGADAESVNPYKVFARDGWACKLCGIATPKHLRGTIEHNAPELDHVHPISKGGAHTYTNTQCLCRSCNGFKSDRTMAELAEALAA